MKIYLEWWNIKSKKRLSEQAVADFHAANPDINIIPIINFTEVYKRNLKTYAQRTGIQKIFPNMQKETGGIPGF